MENAKNSIKKFITKNDTYFKIPEFQRPYTWGVLSIGQFLNDIEIAITNNRSHYFGSIVFVRENNYKMVIDGQQRLTTTFLFIAAIYHLLKEGIVATKDNSAEKIKDLCLYDKYGESHDHRNIILKTVTNDDKVFADIVRNYKDLSQDQKSNKQYRAFMQFYNYLKTKPCLDPYFEALDRFEIVEITLTNTDDNPQLIFESINTTGEPLSSGDKIRNFALMINDDAVRHYAYDTYWIKLERKLNYIERNKERSDISNFFRYFLQCKRADFVSEESTYLYFKEIYSSVTTKEKVDEFYIDTLQYLDAYLFLTRNIVPDNMLDLFDKKKKYQELKYLNFKYIYLDSEVRLSPFMDIFVLLSRGRIDIEDVIRIFRIFESFLVRIICSGSSLSGINNNTPTYFKKIRELKDKYPDKSYVDIFSNIILSITGRNIFRSDDVTATALKSNPIGLYVLRYVYYILTSIEENQKDIGSLLLQIYNKETSLSLEHIMPQTKNDEWRKALGTNYDYLHDKYLNNIGNLTLTAYNSKYSNKSFAYKKECDNGFNHSQLNINKLVKSVNNWTETEILARQEALINELLKCFPTPTTTIPISRNNLFNLNDIEEEALTKTKLSQIIIENGDELKEISCRKWIDAVREVAQYCYTIDKDLFTSLCNEDDFASYVSVGGKNAKYVKEIVPGTDIWFNYAMNANLCFKVIKLLCQKYGLDRNTIFEFEKM
jgi:uncharacterized protein with ParB-like and HNH nuclease domain